MTAQADATLTEAERAENDLMRLTGYALAHGLSVVREGTTLIPTVVIETREGRAVNRFEAEDLDTAVVLARGNVDSLANAVPRSVLVFDGYVTVDGNRSDALVAECRARGRDQIAVLAVRYRPPSEDEAFAVTGRLVVLEGMDGGGGPRFDALLAGIREHPHGEDAWLSKWIQDPPPAPEG